MFQETSQAVFNVASLLSTLQSSVSASDVLTLIGSCVGAGMAFVLAWFGGRSFFLQCAEEGQNQRLTLALGA